jgi:hypothetical protein
MGDAPAATSTPPKPAELVALVVRADAHIDVADLEHGSATKATPLLVSRAQASKLLARHPYLTEWKG